MTYVRLITALALVAVTAACDKKADTSAMAEANHTAPAAAASGSMDNMGNMGNMGAEPAATAPIMAKAHGTVTAIDKGAGTITLDHGPIPEAKWPAMTMAFKAAPALLDKATVGDKVEFDVTLTGSAGEVTAIRKQ